MKLWVQWNFGTQNMEQCFHIDSRESSFLTDMVGCQHMSLYPACKRGQTATLLTLTLDVHKFQNQSSLHPRPEIGNRKMTVFNPELFKVEIPPCLWSRICCWSFSSSHPGDQLNLNFTTNSQRLVGRQYSSSLYASQPWRSRIISEMFDFVTPVSMLSPAASISSSPHLALTASIFERSWQLIVFSQWCFSGFTF